MKDEKKKCGLYMRVSTEDQAREEKADLIMRYVKDIELTLVGNEVILKQINFRDQFVNLAKNYMIKAILILQSL